MKVLIDVDELLAIKAVDAPTAEILRQHAIRDTGSTAINILLAIGAIAVAAGILAFNPSPALGAVLGLGFVGAGFVLKSQPWTQWRKLGAIWMVVGALVLAAGVAAVFDQPLLGCLLAALILAAVGVFAPSQLLIALTPLAILAAVGGSVGYWHACYEIAIQEPTLTVVLFSVLGYAGWQSAKNMAGQAQGLALAFTRMCVILVNFGFWIGSLWGDTPGHSWRPEAINNDRPLFSDLAFTLAWAAALLAAGAWGARNGRRFLVNVAATFGGILLYTQWFERLGIEPVSVILGGVLAITIGMGLWVYNRRQLSPP